MRDRGDVHVVYGLSKDLAIAGLRAGVVYTENSAIINTIKQISRWSLMSTDTQFALAEMLGDAPWVERFLDHNRNALANAVRFQIRGEK